MGERSDLRTLKMQEASSSHFDRPDRQDRQTDRQGVDYPRWDSPMSALDCADDVKGVEGRNGRELGRLVQWICMRDFP